MAIFEFQGPDGRTFEIDAPDQSTALSAYQRVSGGQPQPERKASGQAEYNDGTVGPTLARGGAALPPETSGMRSFAQGLADTASFGFSDEIAAGLGSIGGMLPGGHGKSYSELLPEIRGQQDADAEEHPYAHVAGQLTGGVGSGVALARGGLSLAANAANAGHGLARVAGMSALDGGMLGFGQGFGSGREGFQNRFENGLLSGGIGVGLGGTLPFALAGGGVAARKAFAPLTARTNPEKYTDLALNTAVRRAGTTPQELSNSLRAAQDDGQNMFNLADALGQPGQRFMSTVARTPNDARHEVVRDLLLRQTGQGPRLSNALSEGFGAPDTAAQRAASLTGARDAAGNINYNAARQGAGAVNLTPAISSIDETIRPGVQQFVNPADDIAGDSIERSLNSFRSRMTDGNSTLTDFSRTLSIKRDLTDAIESARRSGQGNRARVLGMLNREIDQALEEASPAYRTANDTFRDQSRAIGAIDTGTNAASGRMRATDNIQGFNRMSPDQQSAFRAGYADPWISKVEAASQSPTTNKARMLGSEKTNQEFPAFAAPGQADQLSRRIGREDTMFQTLTAATGGSKTADNLADMADMSQFDPSVMQGLLTGGWKQGLTTAVMRGLNEVRGLPPGVVERVGRSLMTTSPEEALTVLNRAAQRGQITARQQARVTTIINNASAGLTGRLGSP
ncbi:hypothetical protein [Phyllobacterium sp. SB3]|uniref:hypothetical protein n=1 Tax=Phyllobacterium sp. SB3 TaxID=3156073 RepID=UPI0032AF7977